MKVSMSQLEVVTEVNLKKTSRGPVSVDSEKDRASNEIDLRGMTGEEALAAVDKFLDRAVLSGLNRVDIIHGKGTGSLRTQVTRFLNTHAHVKSHRKGEWNEGDLGVTVVELK